MDIKKVGVVGCGIMGSGIAQVCAQAGYDVIVSDTSEDLLQKGLASIDRILSRSVEKGRITHEEKEAVQGRMKGTISMDDFSGCDYMIEAVIEDLKIKQKVFEQLDKICPDHAILATNTSVLTVIDIASATKRPEKVIGTHFANPVPVMKIVEVVKTIATSEETLAVTRTVCENLEKKVVVAKDGPGFLANRISTPLLLNAVRALEEGAGTREDIDTLMKDGLGHPMGPLTLLDLIGIDTVCRGAEAIYEQTKDPQYNPPSLMRQMVAVGWLGRKTGKGFYEYK